MHTRRLITFLLGAWFALLITSAAVATLGFQVAHNAAKSVAVETVAEPMFRYVAAEINRALFGVTGLAELVLLLILATLLFTQKYSRVATILAGVMLLAAFASTFLLTPQVVAQGRLLDFRPAEMLLEERARFAKLHMLFGVVSVFRLACGVWITGIMLLRGPNSRIWRSRGNVDDVDHAQHGHIDG